MSRRRRETNAAETLPVQVGETYEMTVAGLTHDGDGVGQVAGFTLFVRAALPGDVVRVMVEKTKKTYGFARMVELVKPSANRVEPPCAVFAECGGCQLQHLSYEAQLVWKRQMVTDSLLRIAKLEEVQMEPYAVHPTLGMEQPWAYRNKMQVPVALADSGTSERGSAGCSVVRPVMGFYARGSHRVIDMEYCLIQDERADAVVAELRRLIETLNISVYDERTHRGCLRQVLIRSGYHSGELMAVFVTNGEAFPQAERMVSALRARFPELVSIVQNVNSERTNAVLGRINKTLWGKSELTDSIGDVRYAISARSFFQVNPIQTDVLYQTALAYAGLTGNEVVIDAYCGIGSISLFLARAAKYVYGVEIVADAVADARRNAELNGIANVEFEVGAAEDVMPSWRARGVVADVIVVDPPRKGCDRRLLETILEMAPSRVVYVSCNPATLARDVRVLAEGGYRLVEVQPVDMFPQTTHVECCVLLTRE